jgi:hypothetical protein
LSAGKCANQVRRILKSARKHKAFRQFLYLRLNLIFVGSAGDNSIFQRQRAARRNKNGGNLSPPKESRTMLTRRFIFRILLLEK